MARGVGLEPAAVCAVLLAPALLAGCAGPGTVEIADIHGMAIDPTDSNTLYVATHHGLFRANNDEDWAAVTQKPFDMMGFTMHPSDARLMYASGHPRMGGLLGFAESTDAGQTWQVISLEGKVDFHAMTLSLAQPDRVWGYFRGIVQRSDDGGMTWHEVSTSPPQMAGMASHATDPDTVYVSGPAGVHTSTDGGATFHVLHEASGQASVIATSKADPDLIIAYFAQGGLKRSSDRGNSWNNMNLTFTGNDGAAAIAIDPQDPDTVYVGSYRALIRKTDDGGATWTNVR